MTRRVLNESDFYNEYFDYLITRGVNAQRISKQNYKTPDLQMFSDDGFYLNEVKIPELIFDPVQNVYVFKTIHSKLLEFISKALKQFEGIDYEHSSPWVITFAANHFQMNWKKFNETLSGGVEYDGLLNPDFTNTHVFERMRKKIQIPDLYIWFQISESDNSIYQVSFFVNPSSKYAADIKMLVNQLSSRPISFMDNYIALQFD